MSEMNQMTNTNNTLAIQFQSTSAMPASGSAYSSNPMIGSDGQATYNTQSYSPAATVRGNLRKGTGTPGFPVPENQQPIGDAPWMLMALFAMMYIVLKRMHKRIRT